MVSPALRELAPGLSADPAAAKLDWSAWAAGARAALASGNADLCQFDFAHGGMTGVDWSVWRLPVALAVVLVLVQLIGMNVQWLTLRAEQKRLDTAMRAQLQTAFPNTPVILDPPAQMRRQGEGGSIINITSIDAVHPSGAGLSHYGTSKHAIWGLTKSMALELAPDGIRVNAIAPGPSLTEGAVEFVQAGAPEGIDVEAQWAAYEARIPLRRLAHPDDVGRAAVFLASGLASYVNGAQMIVDGGLLAA
jgi:NAD(P)-dependent dehydrogenase (short-subunit alcohol dehydrogenase family)